MWKKLLIMLSAAIMISSVAYICFDKYFDKTLDAASYTFPNPNIVFEAGKNRKEQLSSGSYKDIGSLSGVSWPTSGDWMSFPGGNKGVLLSYYQPQRVTVITTFKFSGSGPKDVSQCVFGNLDAGGISLTVKRLSNGSAFFLFQIHANGSYQVMTATLPLTDINETFVLVGTYDGTNMHFFVNGTKVGTKQVSGTIQAPKKNTVWAVGGNPSGTQLIDEPFTGFVKNAYVFDSAIGEQVNYVDMKNKGVFISSYTTKANKPYHDTLGVAASTDVTDIKGSDVTYCILNASGVCAGTGSSVLDIVNNGDGTVDLIGKAVGKVTVRAEYHQTIPTADNAPLSTFKDITIIVNENLSTQYKADPQPGASTSGTYEMGKNVNVGQKVGYMTSKNGSSPFTYTMVDDTGYPGESANFEVDNNGVVIVKSGGPNLMTDGSGLRAGTYHFCVLAADADGDSLNASGEPTAKDCVTMTVNKGKPTVAFDDPNLTSKSIAEATIGWNETATANPTVDTLVTYAKSSGSVALINIDPDTGKITYAGSGGYGKVIIKATADDDPNSGYDDYNPSDTTKEIVIYREVDGTITPHTNSSSTTSPTFQTNDNNIKPNGIIGHITGILGTPDDGASGNTTYTYGLKNVDDYNFFSVNPNTGEIRTTADLSTTTGNYDITVTVSDKWSTKEIAVKINVGLAPAEDLRFYETSAAILMITSKSVVSTDTGVTVFATVKNSSNTNPVTYKIKDGSSDVIEVHPTSGAITIHGVGTKIIVAEKAGGSGQADATAELTFTVTAGEQDFIYTDASKNKLPQSGNKYSEYKETYAPNKTFQLYTDGNPPGSSVTYQLKAGSPNDVITVDANGLVHILNASMNTQIGKVIVEATSHDPSGNYSDKTIELPITIEKGTRVITFAEDPIYVINGSGSVVPNILTDGILDTDNDITIEVDSNENSVAWTNDGVTIQYNWNDANGKDIAIHAIKQDDRNYKVAETDGVLHILGADEKALSLSTPGKIIYGDHFVIKSTQNDGSSTNVKYTFESDNQVFISAPMVNGNKAEFDALGYSGSTTINVKVTRTADGEMPLSKTVTIKVLPKPITITIDDKEKKRLEENPPLTYQDFTSQLVSWSGVKDDIDTIHIKLSTTAKKYSPIGSYPISAGNAEKQLNDNYPNYTFTIKQGLLNVVDNGNKDFTDIDDDDCPDLNIKVTDDNGNEITINGDLNDDGIPDYNIDTNGDGKPDLNIDTDKDGRPDINLVMLKEWKPTKCVTLGDISFSSGIAAKAEINIDLNDDQIPDINIDNKGDFKSHLNISKDGKTPYVNIAEIHTWEPIKDYRKDKFLYDSISEDQEEYQPKLNIDSDDDGRPDINIDLDGDGKADINIDIDLDGIPDIDIDSNGDGKPDINIDTNGDGKPDENIKEITEWKPEHNVNEPFDYDTMTFDEPNDNPPNSEVNGSYYPGDNMGGALTGDDTNIRCDFIINVVSIIVLTVLFWYYIKQDNVMAD